MRSKKALKADGAATPDVNLEGQQDPDNNTKENPKMKLFSSLRDELRVRRDNAPWARRLDHLLMRRGITTAMLARMCDISYRQANRLRTGRRVIGMRDLWLLSTGLGISVVDFLAELEAVDND